MRRSLSALFPLLLTAAVGCGTPTSDGPNDDGENSTNGKGDQVGGEEATMCAAVRGNGQLIPAHFASLARIVEHYGTFHAVSGGSSGSITSFFLASMQANPQTFECGGKSCDEAERRERVALLLKSFQGYLDYLLTSDEAMAVRAAMPIVQQVREQGLAETVQSDPEAARTALLAILEQGDLARLVNPELIALLRDSPDPEYHVADIIAAVEGFGAFAADDPKILVRPGVLSFEELARRLGVAASFYAGYGPYDAAAMEAWLGDCSEPAFGQTWSSIRNLPRGESTCGAAFVGMMGAYHDAYASDAESRLDDPVGYFMPALISTSVLTGDAVAAWESASQQYRAAEEPSLEIDFDDVRFGYFGDAQSLDALEMRTLARDDMKSQKALGLGTPTWREALALSPAEPGLARALEIDTDHVSAGGWSDLHPVLVLKDLGCDHVVYVTRTDAESGFARGVATLLGMGAEDDVALYDLGNPASSFSQSLAAADAVWCTNWNDVEATNIEGVVADAYAAPLQSTDEFFTAGEGAYPNVTSDTGLEGCTVP